MLELKIIKGVAHLHSAIISLSIHSLAARENRAYKRHAKRIQKAKDMSVLAKNIAQRASDTVDYANATRSTAIRRLTSAGNVVANAKDDLHRLIGDVTETTKQV